MGNPPGRAAFKTFFRIALGFAHFSASDLS